MGGDLPSVKRFAVGSYSRSPSRSLLAVPVRAVAAPLLPALDGTTCAPCLATALAAVPRACCNQTKPARRSVVDARGGLGGVARAQESLALYKRKSPPGK